MPDSYFYGKWYEENISEVLGPSNNFQNRWPLTKTKKYHLLGSWYSKRAHGFNAKIGFNQNVPKSKSPNQTFIFLAVSAININVYLIVLRTCYLLF